MRKHCSLVLQTQGFSLACQDASSSLLPAPIAQPVPLAAAVAAAGAGGGRGVGAVRRPGVSRRS